MHFHQLLALARAGDTRATDELFSRYYRRVSSITHRAMSRDLRLRRPWLSSRFSTGDVVQEVFRGVLRDIGEFRGEDEPAFIAFLVAIVRLRIIDAVRFHEALRRDPRRSLGDSELDSQPGRDSIEPSDAARRREDAKQVLDALASLSPRERLLFEGRVESFTPFRLLAGQLGYPSEDAARKAYCATRARLVVQIRRAQLAASR